MLHPERKKQRLDCHRCNDEAAAGSNDFQASIESLSGDVLANILGFLIPADIMNARLNNKMREAAKITIVPPTYELVVDSAGNCNAMSVMAAALPHLQKITLSYIDGEHKYVDGEDPDEELAVKTANYTTHDIRIIANFTNLRELQIRTFWWPVARLNGRYPCFFNFPLLQKLTIIESDGLKFDLEMLAGLPSLKEFYCEFPKDLTGNLNSLRVLKDTLEKVRIRRSRFVKGNFMDLADFPHLKQLDLLNAPLVTGGIQNIGEKDFPSLKVLALPNGGNGGVVFQRISDAQDVARTPYLFQKQRPSITILAGWYAKLSEDSPDWYGPLDEIDRDYAPVFIRLVRAASRVGYRWEAADKYHPHPCEVNWLDPEPDRESTGYEKYMEELQEIENEIDYFKGFHQPPTQEEFERILERIHEEEMIDDDSNYDGEI